MHTLRATACLHASGLHSCAVRAERAGMTSWRRKRARTISPVSIPCHEPSNCPSYPRAEQLPLVPRAEQYPRARRRRARECRSRSGSPRVVIHPTKGLRVFIKQRTSGVPYPLGTQRARPSSIYPLTSQQQKQRRTCLLGVDQGDVARCCRTQDSRILRQGPREMIAGESDRRICRDVDRRNFSLSVPPAPRATDHAGAGFNPLSHNTPFRSNDAGSLGRKPLENEVNK